MHLPLYKELGPKSRIFFDPFEIKIIFEGEKYPRYKDPLPIRNFGGQMTRWQFHIGEGVW